MRLAVEIAIQRSLRPKRDRVTMRNRNKRNGVAGQPLCSDSLGCLSIRNPYADNKDATVHFSPFIRIPEPGKDKGLPPPSTVNRETCFNVVVVVVDSFREATVENTPQLILVRSKREATETGEDPASGLQVSR